MSQLRRVLSICFHVWVVFSFFLIEFVTHSNANGPPSLAQCLGTMLTGKDDTNTIQIFVPPAADWTNITKMEDKFAKQSAAIDGVRGKGPQGGHSKSIMARMREHREKSQVNKDAWMSVPDQ